MSKPWPNSSGTIDRARIGVAALAAALLSCAAPALPPAAGPAPSAVPFEAVLKVSVGDGRMCSAVAILPDVALTARHCWVPEGNLRTARVWDISEGVYHIAKFALDDDRDIAAFQLEPGERFAEYATVAPELPPPGVPTWTAGYGCPPTGEFGIRPAVFGHGPDQDGEYRFDGVVCPGDSGGAHFDYYGRLLGINNKRETTGKPVGWMVPAGEVAEALVELLGSPDAGAGLGDSGPGSDEDAGTDTAPDAR